MCNIGVRPTFGENKLVMEIHFFHDKMLNLYGERIKIEFLERILEYESDIINQRDILIIAELIRNILDDFSYEFGYINNEDVYDRVFSNFCIGK